jgi:hypothetical protein
MKRIIISITMLILSASSFSQQTKSLQQLTREEYFTKSKNQKATGWVALGGGTVVLAITAISSASNVCIGTGCTKRSPFPIAAVLGTTMMVSSAPLFIAAGRNKKIALEISTSLKFEKTKSVVQQATVLPFFPVVAVKINL